MATSTTPPPYTAAEPESPPRPRTLPKKELLGFQVGMRESAQSWRELLVELEARGLAIAPELATGDGALGFWKALEEAFPTTRHICRSLDWTPRTLLQEVQLRR
jgi:FAD/FMN-containing dehydrogenase